MKPMQPPANSGPWGTAPRILIVDDDEVLLAALPLAIQHRLPHCVVDTADTPEQALALVQATDYDAVISDLCMPKMDGVTLLRKLQALHPQTPVLLISGRTDETFRGEAIELGAYAFLNKPLDPDFMVALLKQAIVQHRLHLLRPACSV